ncbi:MAG: hypothetical protein UZ21_OP11001000858 [Microgenomates bacterium OLB22]|nr:MAG: hypothetical protein UZ21_OP11001000858 [Microgenomates bacterium OLB22]
MITKCLAGTGKEVSRAEVLERLKPAIEAGFVEPLYQKRGDTRYQLSATGRVATQEWAGECHAQGLVSA